MVVSRHVFWLSRLHVTESQAARAPSPSELNHKRRSAEWIYGPKLPTMSYVDERHRVYGTHLFGECGVHEST